MLGSMAPDTVQETGKDPDIMTTTHCGALRRAGAWIALFTFLGFGTAEATPPTLFSQPNFESPVRGDPGDLLLLAGDGFATSDTVVYQSLGDTTQPLVPPAGVPGSNTTNSGVAPVVSSLNVPYSLTVSLPTAMMADQSYALWVVNSAGEWSNGVRINDARPIWFTPDFAYTTAQLASLPRYLKVVGRNLSPAPGGTTLVRLTGPLTYTLTAANDGDPTTAIERYAAIVTLPSGMPAGSYTVQVSRDGVSWLTVADQKPFQVFPDPTTVGTFSVGDPAYGGCLANDAVDDTPCIARAVAAARANGGGTVSFGPGVWDMSNDRASGVTAYGVLVPVGVNLIGSGAGSTTIERGTIWNMQRAIFTLQGQNTVQGITFRDLYVYQPSDPGRQLIGIGLRPQDAQAYNPDDPNYVSMVAITQNEFAQPAYAVQDNGMPIDHLFITYNTFGAYNTGVFIDADTRLTDAVIDYNTFLPSSYIDVAAYQGPIPTGISSAHRVDFSDNVADGTSTRYLYNPATDPRGFRAAFFWTLRGNQERELVSRNTATCSGDKAGDGEAFAFDDNHNMGALPSKQPALDATADTVTVAGPLVTQTSGAAYPAGYFNDFWVTIAQGPGEGQTRRITSYSGTGPVTFTVSPAWDVPPQTMSQITVAKTLWQVYVVDNYVDQRTYDDQGAPLCRKSNANKPAGGLIQLYGQTSDSVVEGNRQYDSGGINLSMGYTLNDPTYATYPDTKYQNFVEVRGNTLSGEYSYPSSCSLGGIQVEYSADPLAGYPPPLLGYGISISHNTVSQADGYNDGAIVFSRPWFGGPAPDVNGWEAVESALVFANSISNIQLPLPGTASQWPSCAPQESRRIGENVWDGMVWHTVFAGNSCTNVANGPSGTDLFLDWGTKSQRVCSGAGGNSCECPADVQGTSVSRSDTLSSTSTTFPGAQSGGNLNIVVVNWSDAPAAAQVTDSSGNTYTRQGPVLLVPASVTGGLASYQAVFTAGDISAATSNSVTVTFTSPVAGATLTLREYHGIDVNTPVDVATGAYGTGPTADSGWVTTRNNNELLLGIGGGQEGLIEEQLVASPGPYHATASVGSSAYWMMHLLALNLGGWGNANYQGLTAPTALAVTAMPGGTINLSWAGSSDNLGVSAYLIERCAGAGCKSFAQIATVGGNSSSYRDTGLVASMLYTYRVRATDTGGLISSYSSTASVIATP
jgi:hypothetical protein